jgi:Flp pilus assembly protein CpaB
MAAKGKRGGRIIILVALILILAVGGVYVWLQMQQAQQSAQLSPTPEPPKRMVNIVITTQLVPRGSEITQAAVMTIEYPEENLVQGTFITDIQSVIGNRARYDLEPGVPLTRAVLIQPSGGSVASFDVPRDFVALPIPLKRLTSVANALAPGDHVMVIGCMLLVDIDPDFQSKLPNQVGVVEAPGAASPEGGPTTASAGIVPGDIGSQQGRAELDPTLNQPIYVMPSESQRPRMVCQTVIQDAVVLRVGDFADPQSAAAVAAQQQQQQDQQQQQQQPVQPQVVDEKLVTLVVSPQDAVALNYMLLSEIRLNLALRNPSDTRPIVTDAVTQQYLMDQKNIPLPAKLPYSLEPRKDVLIFPTVPLPPTQPVPEQ